MGPEAAPELFSDVFSRAWRAWRAFSNDVRVLALTACEHLVDAFLTANGVVADVKMTFMELSLIHI